MSDGKVISFNAYYKEHYCQICGKRYRYPEGCSPQTCQNAPASITVREWRELRETVRRLEQRFK